MTELTLFACCVLGFLYVVPVGLYRRAVRRAPNEWVRFERLAPPEGGAYRGGWIRLPRDPGAPRLVRIASAWSFALLGPAILSIPVMLLGVLTELERQGHSGVGPAAVFGPSGLLLAAFVFLAGWKLLRRQARARRFARVVAIWSVLHNVAVVYAVIASSEPERAWPPKGPWEDFGLGVLGWVAITYAAISLGHAFTLLAATYAHERVAAVDERSAQLSLAT